MLRLDHDGFAVRCPLALLSTASYPVLVHRPAASLRASSPHSVALMQLRFASFAVVSLWKDLHLQDRAHAGRTTKHPALVAGCARSSDRGWARRYTATQPERDAIKIGKPPRGNLLHCKVLSEPGN
jgi:hypothetical protein